VKAITFLKDNISRNSSEIVLFFPDLKISSEEKPAEMTFAQNDLARVIKHF
jgi:hypothetical protein